MRTYLMSLISELEKRGFTLKEVNELPSEVVDILNTDYALDNSDKVMSRVYNNKYQIIIPQEESELESVNTEYLIFDPNESEKLGEKFNGSQDKVTSHDLIMLDAYSKRWINSAVNGLATYSKVNKLDDSYEDLKDALDKMNSDEIKIHDIKDSLSPIMEKYSQDGILDIFDMPVDEVDLIPAEDNSTSVPEPTSESTEPSSEVGTETLSVNSETNPSTEEVNVVSTESPEGTVITVDKDEAPHVNEPEVTPESTPEVVNEPSEPASPEVTTESTSIATEPEVATEPEEDVVILERDAYNEIMDRMSKLEGTLNEFLSKFGVENPQKESLESYGKRMYRLAHTPMGGELL